MAVENEVVVGSQDDGAQYFVVHQDADPVEALTARLSARRRQELHLVGSGL